MPTEIHVKHGHAERAGTAGGVVLSIFLVVLGRLSRALGRFARRCFIRRTAFRASLDRIRYVVMPEWSFEGSTEDVRRFADAIWRIYPGLRHWRGSPLTVILASAPGNRLAYCVEGPAWADAQFRAAMYRDVELKRADELGMSLGVSA